jgi:hypothetical protein
MSRLSRRQAPNPRLGLQASQGRWSFEPLHFEFRISDFTLPKSETIGG